MRNSYADGLYGIFLSLGFRRGKLELIELQNFLMATSDYSRTEILKQRASVRISISTIGVKVN